MFTTVRSDRQTLLDTAATFRSCKHSHHCQLLFCMYETWFTKHWLPCTLLDNEESIIDHAGRQRAFLQRVHAHSLWDDKYTIFIKQTNISSTNTEIYHCSDRCLSALSLCVCLVKQEYQSAITMSSLGKYWHVFSSALHLTNKLNLLNNNSYCHIIIKTYSSNCINGAQSK